ncbi:MAG: hypothetical protein ACLGI9_08245, partial [Thermoanaerobaculia bacterium]
MTLSSFRFLVPAALIVPFTILSAPAFAVPQKAGDAKPAASRASDDERLPAIARLTAGLEKK